MPSGGAPTFCSVCGRKASARRLCANHYKQWQYRQNPEKYRAWEKRRRARDGERVRAADRERYRANAEAVKRRARIYRARRQGAPGRATDAQIAARFAYWGNRCWMCGGPAESVDHFIPVSRGGTNWPANLRPACRSCNSRKGNRRVDMWAIIGGELRSVAGGPASLPYEVVA